MTSHQHVALVTAAGAGIGRAIAHRLAADGAAVVVSDLADAAGQQVVDEITSSGGTATFVHTDVSDADDVAALIKATIERYGRLDLAVNNAGLGAQPNRLADITLAEWERAISVTLTGTFLCLHAELGHLAKNGGGSIVNVASTAGLQSTPNLAPYGASKHGVVSLTRSTSTEYAAQGIRVNAVAPGPIETAALASLPADARAAHAAEVPMARLGQPEEIASAVAWLLSDEASFVTGVVLPVDGGSLNR